MAYSIARYTWTIKDYDAEKAPFSVHGTLLSSSNFNAQASLRSALENSLVDIMGGVIVQLSAGNFYLSNYGGPPTTASQRELKWLIGYHGNTTKLRYTVTVPCAKVTLLNPNRRGHALLSDPAIAMFIVAFQAFVKTPTGDTVTVDEIRLVGRNV